MYVDLEQKIARASKVEIHYSGPYQIRYAIVEYFGQAKKPLKVISYYIYGEELKTGDPLICWHWQPSMCFNVLEDNFITENEATIRMKELRRN